MRARRVGPRERGTGAGIRAAPRCLPFRDPPGGVTRRARSSRRRLLTEHSALVAVPPPRAPGPARTAVAGKTRKVAYFQVTRRETSEEISCPRLQQTKRERATEGAREIESKKNNKYLHTQGIPFHPYARRNRLTTRSPSALPRPL